MSTKRPQILIVDDEKNIRLTLSHSLQMLGYDTVTAVNGEDALRQCETGDFDLALLDLRMPGMDGMEALRRIVELRPHIRIVIVTAYGTVENAVEALKLGAVDFIQKPFTPQEIRELVTRVLDRQHLEEAHQTDYATCLELAKRSINEQRFDDADVYVRRAIAADPSRPEAFNLLGVLCEMRGDHRQAMTNYRVALDLDSAYAPAQANLLRSSDQPGPRHRRLEL